LQESTGPPSALHAPVTVSASASVLQVASLIVVCPGPQTYLTRQSGPSTTGSPALQTPSMSLPEQSAAAGRLPNSSKKQAMNTCRTIDRSYLFVARTLMAEQSVISPFVGASMGKFEKP
jgi:hypothetical protein